jgi:hypothetical protein
LLFNPKAYCALLLHCKAIVIPLDLWSSVGKRFRSPIVNVHVALVL